MDIKRWENTASIYIIYKLKMQIIQNKVARASKKRKKNKKMFFDKIVKYLSFTILCNF